MVGIGVVAADTDEEAQRLATTQQQEFLNVIRGRSDMLQPPVESMEPLWTWYEAAHVRKMLHYAVVGSRETIHEHLKVILAETGADELIAMSQIYDHEARLRSYEILAEVIGELSQAE